MSQNLFNKVPVTKNAQLPEGKVDEGIPHDTLPSPWYGRQDRAETWEDQIDLDCE